MTTLDNIHQSEFSPRTGNRFTRWIAGRVLKALGWKVRGQLPNVKKCIFIGAPHTSNWDLIIALASMQYVGLKCSWMMKKEAFVWPLAKTFKKMGGIPIDRSKKTDITTQITDWFAAHDNVWLGITPEGTRSKVENFKKGYLRIAYAAGVPIFIVAINAPTKEVILDKLWDLKFDTEIDNRRIKAHYDKNYIGIRP